MKDFVFKPSLPDYSREQIKRRVAEITEVNPMPDCALFSSDFLDEISKQVVNGTEQFIIKKMIDAHIDPDVVKKQAIEIERLRKLNEELASGLLGIDINEVKRIIHEYEYLTAKETEDD